MTDRDLYLGTVYDRKHTEFEESCVATLAGAVLLAAGARPWGDEIPGIDVAQGDDGRITYIGVDDGPDDDAKPLLRAELVDPARIHDDRSPEILAAVAGGPDAVTAYLRKTIGPEEEEPPEAKQDG